MPRRRPTATSQALLLLLLLKGWLVATGWEGRWRKGRRQRLQVTDETATPFHPLSPHSTPLAQWSSSHFNVVLLLGALKVPLHSRTLSFNVECVCCTYTYTLNSSRISAAFKCVILPSLPHPASTAHWPLAPPTLFTPVVCCRWRFSSCFPGNRSSWTALARTRRWKVISNNQIAGVVVFHIFVFLFTQKLSGDTKFCRGNVSHLLGALSFCYVICFLFCFFLHERKTIHRRKVKNEIARDPFNDPNVPLVFSIWWEGGWCWRRNKRNEMK